MCWHALKWKDQSEIGVHIFPSCVALFSVVGNGDAEWYHQRLEHEGNTHHGLHHWAAGW